ncbi:MAG: DNA cytosine methyltransferase, partial [Prevotellaceae bacterium]|nr:DNA cytosine methyltransferase [Prevotellaceae bacterium]
QERWRDFPTVSPVCSRHDGLPFDVDRLTVPYPGWRAQSVKAYGNSMVPQVMYEIFKAIEKSEGYG